MTGAGVEGPRPCPGDCNRVWRRADRAAAARVREVLAAVRPLTEDDVRVIEHGHAFQAGDPVWCEACTHHIDRAIWSVPELVFALWEVGHGDGDVPLRVVESRSVRTLKDPRVRRPSLSAEAAVSLPLVYAVTESLTCGHTLTRRLGREPSPRQLAEFGVRSCLVCRLEALPDSGKLAPAERLARRTAGLPGSPAGSPSWLAIEELLAWVGRTEDYLRARIGDPPSGLDWWRGGARDRNKAMAASVRYLAGHLEQLLATRHADQIGREIVQLTRRTTRSAGLDDTTRLHTPCPRCDRRSLMRRFGDEVARCRSCGLVKTLEDLDYLATLTAANIR